ncbi:MAG: tRNA (adenosine(37)-N6)-dimethylallyltransferase MiaA [Ectothiorhodospiraceae bacterium]|nr:tRNA (adenosine(37)-N6)-dimethylallyltransferase MiaA [Ectothiorhodospiraceae bacterium]MCH8503085.1 tRNA (adenosine(37)-N6)-dimethylallyltransferase MiaA [Ectothiorhodospiraceae bacterium]
MTVPGTVPTPVFCLMGPTASGKTGLAVELVQCLPLQIVSVDSALIYRGMDIGTAKPGPELLVKAPHRLIDILEPHESYSAAGFRKDALREIADIRAAGAWPLLVGGTGLYFRALEQGLSPLPEADPALRQQLLSDAERLGWAALHRRLADLDPESAGRIHPNDTQRIQRALEVCELAGRPMSAILREEREQDGGLRFVKWGLMPPDRTALHERIRQRFLRMLEQGFEDEVRALRVRPELDLNKPAMRAVGYRQIWRYLDGDWDRETMIQKGIVATRNYAKRQLTWLRKEAGLSWVDPAGSGTAKDVAHCINDILAQSV